MPKTRNNPATMSVRARRAAIRRRQKRIVVASIIAAGILLVALIGVPQIINANKPIGDFITPTFFTPSQSDFNSMGDSNAPVKITEYSDFQCPWCKKFHDEVEKQIIEQYVETGKVYFTFVPYGPGGNYIGPESKAAANAAFCAGEQGKFWEYQQIIFANQTGENVGDFPENRLIGFSEAVGLDQVTFSDCLNSEKFNDKLNEGIRLGQQRGIKGTPSFLFNDGEDSLQGAASFALFQAKIEALLNK